MGGQSALAAEPADDVGPQRVEGDENDGSVVARPGAARGEKEKPGGRQSRNDGFAQTPGLTRPADRAGGSCPKGRGSA